MLSLEWRSNGKDKVDTQLVAQNLLSKQIMQEWLKEREKHYEWDCKRGRTALELVLEGEVRTRMGIGTRERMSLLSACSFLLPLRTHGSGGECKRDSFPVKGAGVLVCLCITERKRRKGKCRSMFFPTWEKASTNHILSWTQKNISTKDENKKR